MVHPNHDDIPLDALIKHALLRTLIRLQEDHSRQTTLIINRQFALLTK